MSSNSLGKVLVIDDSMMVRQQVRRALVEAGFEIIEAQDGIDALEKAALISDLSLVICDINMPRMNGLEFLAEFRKEPRWKTVPTVVLTTEAQPELVARAKSLDAKGWIIKPFKPALLTAAAKKLARPMVGMAAVAPVAAAAVAPVTPPVAAVAPVAPVTTPVAAVAS